ncbi:hypothetical protein JCM12296A_41760 [Desulfosarcina cetonica]
MAWTPELNPYSFYISKVKNFGARQTADLAARVEAAVLYCQRRLERAPRFDDLDHLCEQVTLGLS